MKYAHAATVTCNSLLCVLQRDSLREGAKYKEGAKETRDANTLAEECNCTPPRCR